MRIAIDLYPLHKYYHAGPKVFLSRLSKSIIKQKLASVKTPFLPFYDIGLFSVYDKSLYRRPYILRVDGIYFDTENTAGITKELNRQIFSSIENSIGVVFISEFSKKMVEKFNGPIKVPYTIIHNKAPLDIFTPLGGNYREKLGLNKNDRVIVTSAHWRRHKRLDETIKLIDILNARDKDNNYILLVLGGGEYKTSKNIIFAGEITPSLLPSWYRTADIYVHLAWIEPCGNTQIEAMACGLPVVCANNGGIGETVIKSNGGIMSYVDEEYLYNELDYYTPPEPDYDALVNDINKIFNNMSEYKSSINIDYHNIDNGAVEYVRFIESVYRKLK